MKKQLLAVLAGLVCAVSSVPAYATVWNWQINNTVGTFTTTGSGSAAGTYSLLDFAVTSSTDGASVGSVSGGQYAASGFSTNMPYDFNWNGSSVTFWNSAGSNGFDWWVFDDLLSSFDVFFGWGTGNANDPSQGAVYDENVGCCSQASYQIAVSEANGVPEPASLVLVALALAGFGVQRYRSQAKI